MSADDNDNNNAQGEDVDGFVEDAKAKLEEFGERVKAGSRTDIVIAGLVFAVPLALVMTRKRRR